MENKYINHFKYKLRASNSGSSFLCLNLKKVIIFENKWERRNVWFKWQQEPLADGYVIYFGKSPEKMYGSIMVYGKNEYYFNGLDKSEAYFFQIEAFNNNGIGPRTEIKKSE
ncbi:fibronectin type III domain-containing protein [uncultured Flavobacterium sp.]|uniref:fibronectin type III domain-containing protein n=1 Tax=uncultured Flavobacterium sp. TaxID=165435 RepID=UPI0030CA2E95